MNGFPYTPSTSRVPHGFSLVQMLVTVAVLAVLSAVALPVLGSAVASVHFAKAKSELVTSLMRGTRYAVATNGEAVMCQASDATATGCAKSADWSAGWFVFGDRDGNRARSQEEPVLYVARPVGGNVRMFSTDGRTRVVFQPNGSTAGSNATFTACRSGAPARAVQFILSNGGRVRQVSGAPNVAASCAAL